MTDDVDKKKQVTLIAHDLSERWREHLTGFSGEPPKSRPRKRRIVKTLADAEQGSNVELEDGKPYCLAFVVNGVAMLYPASDVCIAMDGSNLIKRPVETAAKAWKK